MNWLKKNLASNLTPSERLALIEREESRGVPLLWQAELLSVSRSRLYYEARPARETEIRIKHRLDEWYTKRPCLGSRKLVHLLAEDGLVVGRHTIRRYREEMGLSTLFPKPNLSRPSRMDHRVYPYLLRGLSIERPNQVWGVDITPIKPYLYPSAGRLFVPGGVFRLVLAPGRGMGIVRNSGTAFCFILCRGRVWAGRARGRQQ